MTERDMVCGVCGGPAAQRFANHQDDDGQLWRVPVYVCLNAKCLEARGAVRIGVVPVGGIRT
jgi:hypothetical protein